MPEILEPPPPPAHPPFPTQDPFATKKLYGVPPPPPPLSLPTNPLKPPDEAEPRPEDGEFNQEQKEVRSK
jgi:hypothetical protein